MELFAQRVRERRREFGYTQQEVADYLMVDRTTYNKYEAGHVAPSLQSLCMLADLFDCSIDWLLGREI